MESVTFIQIAALVLGFYMAWNIGANDVANAMGTSVGSKVLTLKKAVILAAVLEFSGAYFIGSNVSETIQKGIVDPAIFQLDPMIFVFGMMGSLLATGVLLQIASYFGLPVSTTHAVVGAVLGFGLCIGGVHAIGWGQLGWIALGWVFSPILSGVISYALFTLIQRKIFSTLNPIQASQKLAPVLIFLCFSVATLSVVYQSLHLDLSVFSAVSIACFSGLVATLVSYPFLVRLAQLAPEGRERFYPTESRGDVEKIFVFLQILSACLVAFAHGANDVSNAIGPVAAVFSVLKTHALSTQTTIPSWLLALGGFGIVLGLATWGWRVIETIGEKITELTPTRGFSAEFGAAITILLASKWGLPISTTHALVGAVFGVGMTRGISALNLRTIREIAVSWVVTIPLCAIMSILSFYLLRFFLA